MSADETKAFIKLFCLVAIYFEIKSFVLLWGGTLNVLEKVLFIYTLPQGNDKTLLYS